MNRQELIDDFELPETEVEFMDALKCFMYNKDFVGLIKYARCLVQAQGINFKKK